MQKVGSVLGGERKQDSLAAASNVEGHAHDLQAQVSCSLEQLLCLCRVAAVLQAQGAASLQSTDRNQTAR